MFFRLSLTVILLAMLGGMAGHTANASHQKSNYEIAKRAVCHYFTGSLCDEAMRIVKCETGGTYSPWSANHQYLGIFQMGSQERKTYGHGNNVWAQAKAAFAYYSSDHSFSHWTNYEPAGCGG